MISIKPDDFATAGNYPAGGNLWNGQPRVITMTTSEKVAGFTPATPVDAPRDNGVHQEHYQTRSLAAYRALQEWDTSALPVNNLGKSCLFPFLVAPRLPNLVGERAVVAIGYDLNDANHLVYLRSLGTGFFEDLVQVPTATTTAGPISAASGATGELLTTHGGGTNEMVSLASLGTVEFQASLTPTPVMYYAEFCAKYFALTAGGAIYRGASFGTMAFGTTPISAATASTLGVPGGQFLDDGTANVIYVGSCTVGGVVRFRILRTADQGATWTVELTCGAGVTGLSAVWSPDAGQFWALDSLGNRFISANGAGFAASGAAVLITALAGASVRHGTMACIGSCVAKVFSPSYFGGVAVAAGVAFTFDFGNTWRIQHVSDVDAFNQQLGLLTLIAANGRFYATDEKRVFRSGLLGYAVNDY